MRLACLVIALLSAAAGAQDERPRARDLGVPFDGTPGPLNAITDVPGVTVGHATIIEDFENGSAARTGVTAVLPRGEDSVSLAGIRRYGGTEWRGRDDRHDLGQGIRISRGAGHADVDP